MTQKDFTPPNGEGTARSGRGEQSGIVDEAKNVASHLASEAKSEVSHRASSQKDRAAESLSTVADALRGTKHELEDKVPAIGDYADKAADSIQQLSEYIRSKSIGEILDTVEQFARRESALFLGGAFAIGLLSGRFLRSSRPGGGGYGGGYGYRGGGYGRDDRELGRNIGRETSMRARGYGGSYRDANVGGGASRGYSSDRFASGYEGGIAERDVDTMRRSGRGGMPGGGDPGGSNIKDVGGSNISSNVNRSGSMSGSNVGGSNVNRDVTKPGGFAAQPPRPSTQGGNLGNATSGISGSGGAGGASGSGGLGASTKPGLTPSTSAPEYGPGKSGGAQSGPAGLSTSSTGQSSNLEEGSAGTGPAKGSNVTPKKGGEVK